jgi:putative tricarboxylic transport membrane protein
MMTAIEGHQMARRGRGAQALATAAIGSFVAGTIGTAALTFLAPSMVTVALLFGPAEYFALMVLALTAVASLVGNSVALGLMSLFLGLLFGTVGLDTQTGQARLAFGVPELLDGIDTVVLAVGLFAVSEGLHVAARSRHVVDEIIAIKDSVWMSRADWARSWKPWLRGTAIGFPIGALPAGGSEIPTVLSYAIEKKLSKHPEEFGSGAIEGVAGPEAANNASAAGVLAPLLSFGLPTSSTAAMLLIAFQQYGLQPGPLLFQSNPQLVWGLIASLYIGNFLLLILNLPMAGVWVNLLRIPKHWLYAGILIFSLVGIWGVSNSWVDLAMMFGVGLLGYAMRVYDFPIAPVLIGLILGPMAEVQMRRALAVGQGDPLVFVSTPLSAVLVAISVLIVIVPAMLHWRRTRKIDMPDETAGV